MAEDNMGSAMAGGMTVMIMLALMVGIMGMYAPTVYTCSLCGATFSSLADLQTHFDTEHPGTPITIEWE